jgi:hypothetical protein
MHSFIARVASVIAACPSNEPGPIRTEAWVMLRSMCNEELALGPPSTRLAGKPSTRRPGIQGYILPIEAIPVKQFSGGLPS